MTFRVIVAAYLSINHIYLFAAGAADCRKKGGGQAQAAAADRFSINNNLFTQHVLELPQNLTNPKAPQPLKGKEIAPQVLAVSPNLLCLCSSS